METIVFVIAHPDDVAAGQGGSALLLKEFFNIKVICATKGERGIPGITYDEAAKIREKEEENACKIIGADLQFLGRINGQLYADKEICDTVTEMLNEIKPVAIITPWPIDYHEDHRAIAEVARKAVQFSEHDIEILYGEEGYLSQTTHFEPEIYIDISEVMDQKIKLMECHKSQNINDQLKNIFTEYGAVRGKEIGVEYAEGFRSMKSFGSKKTSVLFKLKECVEKSIELK